MSNPFEGRAANMSGPVVDIAPIAPNDSTALDAIAVSLYVETGGTVSFVSAAGHTRTVTLHDGAILPVGVRQVLATGTTATGIHGFMVS